MTFLFQKIKEILKGRHFDDTDDIMSNTTATLKAIPQNHFQNCFEGWTRCWRRFIASKGGILKANTLVFRCEVRITFTAMSSRNLFIIKYISQIIYRTNKALSKIKISGKHTLHQKQRTAISLCATYPQRQTRIGQNQQQHDTT